MKINNKGMTLVELIVTFALLLVVVVGLYNLILEVKFAVDEKQIVKNTIEFSSLINNDIHYDLLHDKPFAVLIKSSENVDWTCHTSSSGTCRDMSGNTMGATHRDSSLGWSEGKNQMAEGFCKNIFPCALYLYYDKNIGANGAVKIRGLALGSVDGNTNGDVDAQGEILGKFDDATNKNKLIENGILYGEYDWANPNVQERNITLFEPVEPYDEKGFVEVRDGEHYDIDVSLIEKSDKPYIKFEDGMLIINYALYIVDDDDNKNYGFKIVYPFS